MRGRSKITHPIPIFVISYNRGAYLERVLTTYQAQDVETEIVIHDNGSTDDETLRVLTKLACHGYKVYRYDRISGAEELDNVDESVRRYKRETQYDGPYAVTDCDIDLSEARRDALRTYIEILNRLKDVECVGPMLKIADIPKSYPLFNQVMARHIAQFWHREPEWLSLPIGKVAYLKHEIDTTFAVHRAGSTFRRLKSGARVYHPFEARHLDWYVSRDKPTNYRFTSSPSIAHWDNAVEFSRHGAIPDTISAYTIVEGEFGDLSAVETSTADNPS